MRRRYLYALIVSVGLYAVCGRQMDRQITSTALQPNEKERVIFNPKTHTVTTVTERGAQKRFVGPAGAAVVIGKDGRVRVDARIAGTECSPYLGGAFGTDIQPRAAL